MWSKQLALAIAATVLVTGTFNHARQSFCRMIGSDTRALYLWAEYKMLTGDRNSALKLLQESSFQKSRRFDEARPGGREAIRAVFMP